LSGLFSSIVVGGVEVPNRIVMPPMTTRLADDEGHVTEALVAYYKARALGGVGLITVEMGSPERAGRHRFRELGVYDDRFLPGLERLTTVLHDAGARVSVQLGHGGSRARNAVSDETPIAPSSIPTPVYEVEAETVVPSEMTKARIEQTTQAFVEAGAPRRPRRLRPRRAARGARVPDLPVPVPQREHQNRRVRRLPAEPGPVRPRRSATYQGGDA
jgi:dimethylglycine catabolism A